MLSTILVSSRRILFPWNDKRCFIHCNSWWFSLPTYLQPFLKLHWHEVLTTAAVKGGCARISQALHISWILIANKFFIKVSFYCLKWCVLRTKCNLLYLFSLFLCRYRKPTITCVWQVKSILSSLCLSAHLSVFAYPGIYSGADIRPQWWRVLSSSSLAQTPALMRLPSAGWALGHTAAPCVPPHTGPAHCCPLFPVHK